MIMIINKDQLLFAIATILYAPSSTLRSSSADVGPHPLAVQKLISGVNVTLQSRIYSWGLPSQY